MKRNSWQKLLILLLVAVLVALSGCSLIEPYLPTTETPAPTASPVPVTPIQPGWTPPATQGGSAPLPDMVAVVEKVRPSVVAINVSIVTLDIFNRSFTEKGAGSGWIIDPNGLIVTNNHVVEGAKDISVTLNDGRILTAKQIAADQVSDLAVIKIDATGLPAAKVGDSNQLKVGMPVAAIGNALGEGIIMTGGWVSRIGASISVENDTIYDLIQTDAAINPGNSGGPLANIAGEVIGITNAKLVATGVEGVGYAISTGTALPIITQLVSTGYVVRPWFGISLQTVNAGLAALFRLKVDKGALVTNVSANSPAAAAGLQKGDVLVRIGDKDLTSAVDASRAIRASQIGKPVKVTYWRGDSQSTVDMTPVQSPVP